MPRKAKPLNTDDIVAAYRAGQSITALYQANSVDRSRIRAILTDAGEPLRTVSPLAGRFQRTDIDADAVATAYAEGHSVRTLALRFGASHDTVVRILAAAGVAIRGPSAAKRAKYDLLGGRGSRWMELDVAALAGEYLAGASASELAADHGISIDTVERRLRPLGIMRRAGDATNRERLARTMQDAGSRIGRFEADIADMLRGAGLQPMQQLAVGGRNIDVAVDPVAVEIWWSSLRPDHDAYCRERIVDLADRGWHVAYVHISRRTKLLSATVADEIVAWLKQAQRNPSAVREYRVFRGTGELVARGHVYPERRPLVPASIDGTDAV